MGWLFESSANTRIELGPINDAKITMMLTNRNTRFIAASLLHFLVYFYQGFTPILEIRMCNDFPGLENQSLGLEIFQFSSVKAILTLVVDLNTLWYIRQNKSTIFSVAIVTHMVGNFENWWKDRGPTPRPARRSAARVPCQIEDTLLIVAYVAKLLLRCLIVVTV